MSKQNAVILGAAVFVLAVAAVFLTRPKAAVLPAPPAPEQAPVVPVAQSAECTSAPRTLENGRKEYPIAEKYGHLPWLGQLFTADDCGAERLYKVAGGTDASYPWGSKLFIQTVSDARDAILREIGYVCGPDPVNPDFFERCVLDQSAPVDQLLKLKPYANTIEGDDCVLCG